MVGELIRERRRWRGWSQEELARRMGWRQTYLSRVERGEVDVPQRATLERLGGLLGVTLEEFYRKAGMLEGVGNGGGSGNGEPPEPPSPADFDRRYDPGEVIAFVEAHPDREFREQLALAKARRSPEAYQRLAFAIFRAWTSTAAVMAALELAERDA